MLGQTIGHYRITEQLGAGGMGVVYKARDTRLERDVAVKVIRPECCNPILTAAFLREAQLASSLNHPGIVIVYDLVTHGDRECIVMEFVAGKQLSRLIPDGGFPVARTVRLALLIAEAVAAAHTAGVIHRDLKPANIVVRDDGQVKVLDFGLAKLATPAPAAPAEDSETQYLSIFGTGVVGTIAYMAPEQALGQAVDCRSDIFSFGVLLYEMLAGSLPFPGADAMKMLYDEPRPLRELRPDIPAVLHDLTHRAMAKLPQNRFAGMNEIELLLRRISSDLANSEAGAAVRSTAAATGPPAAGSERTSIAVLPFRCLSADKEDTYMAEGITTEIISALSGVPGVRVAPHLASIRFRDSAQDISEAATTLNVRYIVTGSLRRSGPRTRVIAELSDVAEDHLIWSHTYDRAVEDVFAVQEHIARSVAGATGGQLLRVRSEQVSQAPVESLPAWELVRKAYHFWNYAFHIEGVNESLDLLRRAVQLDPGYAVAHGYLGFYLNQRLNAFISPDRKADRQECLAAAQRAFELAPGNPEVLEIVGMIWCCAAQADRAVTALRRAVQIAPFNLVAWGYLTLPLGWGGDQKEVAEAQQILDRLIADTPDHPSLPYWYYFKTGACFRQENFGVAAECAQKCFELQPRYLIARMAYSNALGALGHLDEARAAWSQVLAMNPYVTQEAYMEIITAVARTPERTEPHVRGFFAAGIFK